MHLKQSFGANGDGGVAEGGAKWLRDMEGRTKFQSSDEPLPNRPRDEDERDEPLPNRPDEEGRNVKWAIDESYYNISVGCGDHEREA